MGFEVMKRCRIWVWVYLSDEMENVFDDNRNQNQNKADGGDGPCRRLFQGPSGATSGHEKFREREEEEEMLKGVN